MRKKNVGLLIEYDPGQGGKLTGCEGEEEPPCKRQKEALAMSTRSSMGNTDGSAVVADRQADYVDTGVSGWLGQ